MPDICQRYAKVMSKNDKDIPKICQRYAKDMSGVIMWLQIQDNYLKLRYAKDMPEVIPKLQIQDNYLKQIYAKYMPKICQRQLHKAVVKLPKI